MKPVVVFLILLASCGTLLGASQNPASSPRTPPTLLEDLVRLTRAGSSDATVLAYAKAHRLELPPEVSDKDLRYLRDSGVSETVVRYMRAIDIRASDEVAQQDMASGSYPGAARPGAAYSDYGNDDASEYGGYPDSYTESYADGYCDTCAAGYDYPFYDYGYYPYPYPFYFFNGQLGFFGRFGGRDHRFRGGRGFDGGREVWRQRGNVVGHAGSRDAWRARGFRGGRGSTIVVRPRGSARPSFARGGFGAGPQGPRGRAIAPRGFGPRGFARGNFANGFRGPRGGGAFSSSPHTGGGFRSSPHTASGFVGGRGRR